MIERCLQRCLMPVAQGHHQLPFRGVLQYLVSIPVGQINAVVRADIDVVGILQLAFTPGPCCQHAAFTIEDQHRRATALEHIYMVKGVDGHGAGILEVHTLGQTRPVTLILVDVVPHSDG